MASTFSHLCRYAINYDLEWNPSRTETRLRGKIGFLRMDTCDESVAGFFGRVIMSCSTLRRVANDWPH